MSKETPVIGRIAFGPAVTLESPQWSQKQIAKVVPTQPTAEEIIAGVRTTLKACLSPAELEELGISDDRDIFQCVTRALCGLKDRIDVLKDFVGRHSEPFSLDDL